MKPLRHQALFSRITSNFASALFLAASLPIAGNLVHAQSETSGTVTDLPLVAPTNVPPFANFYSLSTFGLYFKNTFGPPLPWNPCPECPVYFLGSNSMFGSFSTNTYVVDDASVLSEGGMSQTTTVDPPPDPGGGTGGDPNPPDPIEPAYSYPSNYLYLIIDGVETVKRDPPSPKALRRTGAWCVKKAKILSQRCQERRETQRRRQKHGWQKDGEQENEARMVINRNPKHQNPNSKKIPSSKLREEGILSQRRGGAEERRGGGKIMPTNLPRSCRKDWQAVGYRHGRYA
jgi:hypothetical protein